MLVTKVAGSHWIPQYEKITMEFNGYQQLFGYTHSLKYIFLTLIQVWNNLRVSKWWQDFHFHNSHYSENW